MQSLEHYLNDKYLRETENIYLGDTRTLFDGTVRLKDAVTENIDRYLQKKTLLSWGVKAQVTVTTKRGTIMYPAIFEDESSIHLPDPMQTAADNYKLMQEGLLVDLDLKVEHNTLLSNVILICYIFISLLILNIYYRSGLKKARLEELEKEKEINRLLDLEEKYGTSLTNLEKEKKELISEYDLMKRELENEKKRASSNEEEMIEEIVALDEKINKNLARQKEQQEEISALQEKLNRHDKGKPKIKASEVAKKRFNAIYKNLSIQEKAISGFIDLTDNMKIKAEEVIHQLNQNSTLVPIKRKVFGKKGRETVLEVIFAYKGRLYFRRLKDNRIEILAIGTKNVQARDLEFLDNL